MTDPGRPDPDPPGARREPEDTSASGGDPQPGSARSSAPGELADLVTPNAAPVPVWPAPGSVPPWSEPGVAGSAPDPWAPGSPGSVPPGSVPPGSVPPSGWTGPEGSARAPAAYGPAAGPDGSNPGVGWAPQVAPAVRTGASKLRIAGWLIVGSIVAAGAIGSLFFRDQLTDDVSDLRVGDCFEYPSDDGNLVEDVQHRPCTDTHDAEVIFIGNYPNQDAYPSEDAIDTYVEQECIPAFQAYVGRAFEGNGELGLSWFYPTPDGWEDKDDREVTCSVTRVDGEKLTTSVKA